MELPLPSAGRLLNQHLLITLHPLKQDQSALKRGFLNQSIVTGESK